MRSSIIIATLVCAVIVMTMSHVAFADVDVTWIDCGSPKDTGKTIRITANTWPPKLGDKMEMHQLHNFTSGPITSGTYEVISKWGASIVDDTKGDLCAYGTLTCPTPLGLATIDLPRSRVGGIPSGNYSIHTTALDNNGGMVFCHEVRFQID